MVPEKLVNQVLHFVKSLPDRAKTVLSVYENRADKRAHDQLQTPQTPTSTRSTVSQSSRTIALLAYSVFYYFSLLPIIQIVAGSSQTNVQVLHTSVDVCASGLKRMRLSAGFHTIHATQLHRSVSLSAISNVIDSELNNIDFYEHTPNTDDITPISPTFDIVSDTSHFIIFSCLFLEHHVCLSQT